MEITRFNPMLNYGAGLAAGQVATNQRNKNALAGFMQSNGQQLMQGDSQALNRLAAMPGGLETAMSIRGNQAQQARADRAEGREIERLQMAKDAVTRSIAERAQSMEAAEFAREVEDAKRAAQQLFVAHQAQDPDLFNQVATANEIPVSYEEYGQKKYLIDHTAEVAAAQYEDMMKPRRQLSVKTPDGVEITDGYPTQTLAGQNPATTGTPRDTGTMQKELSKSDAETLAKLSEKSRNSTEARALAEQLGVAASKVGYSGFGGELYGHVDRMAGDNLPGNVAARELFEALIPEAQLAFTQMTKGAISNTEMALFRMAVPTLAKTKEGNKLIAGLMEKGAERAELQAEFYSKWARKYGSLEGADAVWADYYKENPLIIDQGDTIGIGSSPPVDTYLDRTPMMATTPESIMGMDAAGINGLNVSEMTPTQLEALEQRVIQLRSGQ